MGGKEEYMATLQDIENDLRNFTKGAIVIRPRQIADALGQKKTEHVRQYYVNLPTAGKSKTYFIKDVAKNIYADQEWHP